MTERKPENMVMSTPFSRRTLLATGGASLAMLAAPAVIRAQSRPHVVVVGGGFAGATAAKYIRLWSGGTVDVTLVDKNARHASCIMSNLVLNDQFKLWQLKFAYDDLQTRYGVQVLRGKVTKVQGDNYRVRLKDGRLLDYDRLVLATGIAFSKVPGWQASKVPHAWIAGGQTNLLRKQLRNMPDRGTFVLTIPRSPYRCPPGPYERACTVADLLGNRSGILNGGGGAAPRVIVLDANDGIQAEKETFSRAYEGLYGDIVEYHSGVQLLAVDSDYRVAITNKGDFQGDVLNIIPPHRAPWIARKTRSGSTGAWADVDPLTYETRNTEFPGVHVIGDSQATGQPKSGHMANAQAKVCADAIVRIFNGESTHSPERMANIRTNSACYSPITSTQASWLTAVFQYNTNSGQMELAPGSLGEAGNWSRDSYEKMFAWSNNLFADTFA